MSAIINKKTLSTLKREKLFLIKIVRKYNNVDYYFSYINILAGYPYNIKSLKISESRYSASLFTKEQYNIIYEYVFRYMADQMLYDNKFGKKQDKKLSYSYSIIPIRINAKCSDIVLKNGKMDFIKYFGDIYTLDIDQKKDVYKIFREIKNRNKKLNFLLKTNMGGRKFGCKWKLTFRRGKRPEM